MLCGCFLVRVKPQRLELGLGYKVCDLFFKSSHSVMGNLQYRSTVWICQHICADSAFFQDTCHPIALFKFMMYHNQLSWGHYAIYITWLHRHFPSEGVTVFRYLKKHYSKNMYSFSYLAGQYLSYHGNKIICFLCRSYRTWITGRNCQICQSTQDPCVPSQEGTATSAELHPA